MIHAEVSSKQPNKARILGEFGYACWKGLGLVEEVTDSEYI